MASNCTDLSFNYRTLAGEELDVIRPLWERQRSFHAALDWPFAHEMLDVSFENRKRELRTKCASGMLFAQVASVAPDGPDVAYCVSTISADRCGEIDSVFVDEPYRMHGIATTLVRHALEWLDRAGATSKIVTVADGNTTALGLYKRFGFAPRLILLKQV